MGMSPAQQHCRWHEAEGAALWKAMCLAAQWLGLRPYLCPPPALSLPLHAVGVAWAAPMSQGPQPLLKGLIMLLCEDLSRRHKNGLEPVFDRQQHGGEGT